jgi:hypothetical protein
MANLVTFDVNMNYVHLPICVRAVRDLLVAFVVVTVYDLKFLSNKERYIYFLLWQRSEEHPSNPPQRKLSRQ